MRFKEFVEQINDKVERLLEGKAITTVHEVLKNNGVKLTGISIGTKDSNIAPTIYLESYWKKLSDENMFTNVSDSMLQGIAEEIVMEAKKYKNETAITFDWFTDWNLVQKRLAVKLINRESNGEMLGKVPYRLVLDDLALIVYLVLPKENDIKNGVVGSVTITNDHLCQWNKTAEEVIDVALQNTPNLLPEEIRSMSDLLFDILGEEKEEHKSLEDVLIPKEDTFLVLSNTKTMYGAVTILYPNVLKRIAKVIESDLYILPSSVHEVIILPVTKEVSCNSLREMVAEVNQSSVIDNEEVLTNTVYVYKRENDMVQVA